jgi:hypothetical protein
MILLNQQIPANPETYAVTCIGKEGNAFVLPWSAVTSDKIMYIAPVAGKYSIVKNDAVFSDVPSNFWGADEIAFAFSHGLFKGIDNSHLCS